MVIDTPLQVPRWTARQTRRTTLFLIAAAVAVMVLLVASLVVDRLRVANRDRLTVLDQAQFGVDDTFGLLRDMETSQRGFLLTGNDTFLEPYNRASLDFPTTLAQVRSLIGSDEAELRAAFDAFERDAEQWRAAIEPEIEQRRQSGQPGQAFEQAVEDKQRFDVIRSREAEISSLLNTERAQLQVGNVRLINLSLALLALGALSTLMTLSYSILLVRRLGLFAAIQQRRQERQEAYSDVISTLNGATQIQPMLTASLPQVLESVGAQAGVVYLLHDRQLDPVASVGLEHARLTALSVEDGLPGRALQQDRPIVVTDFPVESPYRIHTGIGVAVPASLVLLPLRYAQQKLGVMAVASIRRLTEDEVQQLALTGAQIAVAISNLHAFEETQRIADQLAESNAYQARLLESSDTLQDIGREIVRQSDLQRILDLVCRETRKLIRADYAAVATQIDSLGSTRWAAIDGARSPSSRDVVFPPHRGTAGRVIDSSQPVVIQGLGQNDSFPLDEFPVHVAEGAYSVLGVPLFRRETPIGALIIGFRTEYMITDADVELATALAAYASIALENTRLVSEVQQERDVAEQRAHELALKNKEVERANQLKSQFVANMSHELRTPLNSILALSQILLDRFDGDLNDEQEKQVKIIERNGQNLLRLINDILDLSKIEAGRIDLMPTNFKLPDLISNVRGTIAPLVQDKGLAFQVETDPSLTTCFTDENKLKQILLNLLSNAVKFTERGGITIRARQGREVESAPERAGQWITIEVQDTGIGIAPEDQPAVWEEFRQIDGSLARHYEGTGLGLAIVRRLTRLIGGDIELESQKGQGSTFRLSIPARVPTSALNEPEARPAQPSIVSMPTYRGDERPLVLIVDDDVEVLYILEKFLRDEGYEIVAAQDGDDAILKARQLHPFAITLDVMMPRRDGWEVIQALKSDPSTADIQIIVVSMLDNRQLGYSLGVADYLVKPVSRNDLLNRLMKLRSDQPINTAVIIDDDPVQVRVISTALENEGLDITSFTSGPTALAWLADHTPDLITLDLMMPGMDGFEVLSEVRKIERLKRVPVLIITAKDISDDDRRRLNGQIATIIAKGPQQREELLHEIREVLNRRRVLASTEGQVAE